MIAINLITKTIKIRSDLAILLSDRDMYVELSHLWSKSRWLPDNEPFGFNIIKQVIFMAEGWELYQLNVHGETVRAIPVV